MKYTCKHSLDHNNMRTSFGSLKSVLQPSHLLYRGQHFQIMSTAASSVLQLRSPTAGRVPWRLPEESLKHQVGQLVPLYAAVQDIEPSLEEEFHTARSQPSTIALGPGDLL